jgi:hypothetical protein
MRRRSKYKPVAVQFHHDRVAELGCLVSERPATLHHVTGYADKPGRFSRDEWLVVPLAPEYHQKCFDPLNRMPISVEALSHQGCSQEHGIDLLAEAMRLAAETQEILRERGIVQQTSRAA